MSENPPTDNPTPQDSIDKSREDLLGEIIYIRQEIERLNNHRLVRVYNHFGRFLLFSFARGVFTGLGTVFGATLVASIAFYILSQIELVPILGDFLRLLVEELNFDYNQYRPHP